MNRIRNLVSPGGQVSNMRDNFLMNAATKVADKCVDNRKVSKC